MTRKLMNDWIVAFDLPAAELFAEYRRIYVEAAALLNIEENYSRRLHLESIMAKTTESAAFETVARRLMTPEQLAEIARAQYP